MTAMKNPLTLTAVLLALIVASNANNWCGITCRDPYGYVHQHTMCLFNQYQTAPKCNYVLRQGLDQYEIATVVNYHNMVRRTVANLPPLVWDQTLATVAQAWANQCDYDNHDKCRNLEYELAGQNMSYHWSSVDDVQFQDLLNGWVKEQRLVNSNIIASFPKFSHAFGHYTQMVWAKTTRVGCGFVKFIENRLVKGIQTNVYGSFLVCNYGRAGNVLGEPVY